MIELEIRIKNEGASPAIVERDLTVDSGNVILYITYPDGKIMVRRKDKFTDLNNCTWPTALRIK